MPLVAVIIPCFNYGQFVADAVRSALAQTDADVRAVVVDDGSNDSTTPAACEALASDRVRVIHQPNAGPSAARNRGAREAGAWCAPEYLVFLDADDTIEPTFVSKLAGAIRNDPAADTVSHAYCQERLTELGTGEWNVPEWDPLLLLVTNLHPVTCLVKRSAFESVGGFDESIPGYEDWDLWIKFAERGLRGVRVREPLFVWRRHSHSTRVFADVARHDTLYAAIVDRHRPFFDRHGHDVLKLHNSLLRKFDMNWLDETGYPKPLQYWWSLRDQVIPDLHRQLQAARHHNAELADRAANAEALNHQLRAQLELAQQRRWRARLKHALTNLPRPLGPAFASLWNTLRQSTQPARDHKPRANT